MGYYTDLHCKAIIKPEYRDTIKKIVFEYASWKDFFDHDFVELPRADLIPFGENKLKQSEIFDGINLHIECSIKNYDDEIEYFFEMLQCISDEVSEYKSFDEDNFEYLERGTDCIKVKKWYNHFTGQYEEVEEVLNGV